MRTDITCALGGVSLHELDSRIYVEDIKEDPNNTMETVSRAGYGTFPLTSPERDSLVIKVTGYVKERDRTAREAVYQKILGWCTKGWFTKNTRPGQRIYVYCTKPPGTETYKSARLEVEFTAYGEAYWQDTTPVSVSSSSAVSSATVSITPSGTQECFLEAEIAPSSGTLTSVTITVGSQTLALSGLSVTKTAPLKIYYDEMHLLHIVSGSTSLLNKRSAASSDDILLVPNQSNSVSLTFSRACTYTIKARGLWK